MNKNHYIYPAVFNYEDKKISISFPDLPGCYSCGKNDEEALYMEKDALGIYIVSVEDGEELKQPSKLNAIKLSKNERTVLVEVNMSLFRERVQNQMKNINL